MNRIILNIKLTMISIYLIGTLINARSAVLANRQDNNSTSTSRDRDSDDSNIMRMQHEKSNHIFRHGSSSINTSTDTKNKKPNLVVVSPRDILDFLVNIPSNNINEYYDERIGRIVRRSSMGETRYTIINS
jgi:hypothetical protein